MNNRFSHISYQEIQGKIASKPLTVDSEQDGVLKKSNESVSFNKWTPECKHKKLYPFVGHTNTLNWQNQVKWQKINNIK